MAEINTSSANLKKKAPHKLIKVDLTPMVDLGFLLITFFILTTSMQQQAVMKLILPKDSGPETPLAQSTTLTFILESHDSIGYYEGMAKEIKFTGFGDMRNIIQQKQINLAKNYVDKNKLTLIFKPTSSCTYKNFIDAMDEVTINDCKHYFVAEPGKNEVR